MALIVLASGCATPRRGSSASGGSEPGPPVVEVLPNGLTLVVQITGRPTSSRSICGWRRACETRSPRGWATPTSRSTCLFKGTDTFGPGYIDRAVEGTGGRSQRRSRTYDYTTFQILVPSDAIRRPSGCLDDMAFTLRSSIPRRSTPSAEVIFEETRIQTDNPQTAIVAGSLLARSSATDPLRRGRCSAPRRR